tara:strand:- start:1041 stop:1778 length:738 start_codon:yes stop_codon:yes gene_type:complete
MVFSISEFKSTMYTQESAKQDRFEVLINCPLFNSDNLRYVSLRLKSFSFPERSIRSQSDDNIYGIKRELPQGVLAPAALTAEFYCNVDMSEKRLFEEWQKQIYNNGTFNLKYYKDYVGTMIIHQLSKGSSVSLPGNFLSFSGAKEKTGSYSVQLNEVWPKDIQAQTLDVGADGALQTISVNLSYHKWETIGREPITNVADYVNQSGGKYNIVNAKGILLDVLGKSGAKPKVLAGAGTAADIILGQ